MIALVMLPNLIWLGYSRTGATWIAALILPIALLTVLFALLGRRPWLACLVLAPFALLAPLECFYIARYHTPSTAEIIAILYATTIPETRAYLGHFLTCAVLAPVVGLVIALLAAWLSHRARWRWLGRMRQWIGASALLIAIPLVALSISSMVKIKLPPTVGSPNGSDAGFAFIGPGYPFGVLVRAGRFVKEWTAMRSDARRLTSFSFHARRTDPQPHQRQVYVMVIGESSSRDHWQLFGYQRRTNPELSKQANLIPVKRMVTSWPETIAAVPVMLTRKPITSNKPGWHEPSFLPAMQEAGYQTWWISNQYPIGRTNSPVAMYAYQAQYVVWVNRTTTANDPHAYDANLLAPLRRALQSSNHDLFIVLHTMGSHDNYDMRYPPRFERFKPIFSDDHGGVIHGSYIRNSYDNSILYTDHVLAQIIQVLNQSGTVAALWYESDHGEVLPAGQCKKVGHGNGTWHEFEIPAFFWYSDAYARNFPKRVANLRANADKRTLSGDTFESLIDMAGVTFPGHDETWSLFSRRWHYRTRIVGQFWYTNFDDAVAVGPCGVLKPAKLSAMP
ncbi:MAG TPA: sulfatase-like hydrolase/transferase [Rhodanobacteraceae bacterium]|nr:sulfatase-like hydrolase/transferase [Rhodanobacteraceae bacterium]